MISTKLVKLISTGKSPYSNQENFASRFTVSKDRMTIMVHANRNVSHYLQSRVITKKVCYSPVPYKSQRSACIATEIFMIYFN